MCDEPVGVEAAVELVSTAIALGEQVCVRPGRVVFAVTIEDPDEPSVHVVGLFPDRASAELVRVRMVLREMILDQWGPWNPKGAEPLVEVTDEVLAEHVAALGGPQGLVDWYNANSVWLAEVREWTVTAGHVEPHWGSAVDAFTDGFAWRQEYT